MSFFLMQNELLPIGISKGMGEIAAIIVILIFLGFLLRMLYKILPAWKEIKLAELNVRGEEAKAQVQVATALGGLGNALNQIGSTMHSVAIEQRRATDNVKILQRANADETGSIIQSVDGLIERMDKFEEKFKEQADEQN